MGWIVFATIPVLIFAGMYVYLARNKPSMLRSREQHDIQRLALEVVQEQGGPVIDATIARIFGASNPSLPVTKIGNDEEGRE